MNLLTIMLQASAAPAATPESGSNWMSIGMMVLIFVVFYFFMIRPQSKRQKEVRKSKIPLNVTFNEYIEIAKMYSTARSGLFVNGVLDKIVTELKRSNKLMKAESVYSK